MKEELSISVVLISFNEERNIRRCLESVVDIASEIILVDSFSTDKTLEIAKEFDCKIFQREWPGFGKQKTLDWTNVRRIGFSFWIVMKY